jgi:hypothetical protein
MTGKYLINTNDWFYAPDGIMYKAAWGEVVILDDSVLGIKTNRNSTNWFAKVGSEDKHIIIAGCQINYSIKCEQKPNTDYVNDWMADAKHGSNIYKRPTVIYIAE